MDGIYSFLNLLLPFEWAEFDFMKNALLAVLMITPLFGLTGTMIVNNKMSFFSDALGHSALTGIAIAVMMGIDNYLLSMLGFALRFAVPIPGVMSTQSACFPRPAWRWAWCFFPPTAVFPSIPIT